MPLGIDDLEILTFPIIAGEVSTSSTGVPLAPAGFSFKPAYPVVLADGPEWLVRITRPPDLTLVEEIIPDADPEEPRTFDESHREDANELGEFRFSTWLNDDFAMQPGDLVEFYDRGLCIGGGVIRAREIFKVSKALEGKPKITWAGVRPLGVLEECLVLPVRGFGSNAQDRVWGWFAPGYDPVDWVAPTQIVQIGGTSTYWTGLFPDFHDQDAWWVWASRRAGNPPLDKWSPEGECLGLWTYSVPAGVTTVEYEMVGDAQATLWHEGEEIASTEYAYADPDQIVRRSVSVIPGDQLVAVAGVNDPDPEGDQVQNPGGFAWSVAYVDPATGERTVLAHSDNTGLMLEYPPRRPGVTPGHVLLEVLAEGQALGWCTWVAPTFTAEVDSNGVPWAEVGEIGTKVGYDLWKLASQLIAVYIDSDLTPGTNEWHAWSKGTRGRASGVVFAPSTGDPATGNLQEHTVTETLMRGNDLMTYSRFGWKLHRSGSGGRRIAATLGLGALPTSTEVDRWAHAELLEDYANRIEHDVSILPVGDSDKPYWSYGIGDTVTIDGEEQPVVSIGWERGEDGRIRWNSDGPPS